MIEEKKLDCGFSLPALGFGTWQMGGRYERNSANDDARDVNGIKNAVKAGITHIDTAEIYAGGHAEELVAEGIRGFDRKKLFIASKVYWEHLDYKDVIESAKKSLKRLQTDYLDLYLVHGHNPSFDLRETMKAMDELVETGLVKNIGVCNFSKETLDKAQGFSASKIVCNQVHYNLIYREPEKTGLLDYCRENDVMLVAWRPVEKGVLAKNDFGIVDGVCKKYSKTPAQIAVNWLASQENVVTIAKMADERHLIENLAAVNWKMDEADVELLREKFPGQKSVSNAVPLG